VRLNPDALLTVRSATKSCSSRAVKPARDAGRLGAGAATRINQRAACGSQSRNNLRARRIGGASLETGPVGDRRRFPSGARGTSNRSPGTCRRASGSNRFCERGARRCCGPPAGAGCALRQHRSCSNLMSSTWQCSNRAPAERASCPPYPPCWAAPDRRAWGPAWLSGSFRIFARPDLFRPGLRISISR